MAPASSPLADLPPATRWSAYAGLYLFACGMATAALLSDVLALLADVIGLPAGFATAIFAGPALVVGAVAWWELVERRGRYAYRVGAAVGVVTAGLTAVVWTARFVSVWGVELLRVEAVALLAGVVVGVAVVAGALVGLPLMYARRRVDGSAARTGGTAGPGD